MATNVKNKHKKLEFIQLGNHMPLLHLCFSHLLHVLSLRFIFFI